MDLIKHKSTKQEGLYYWAEEINSMIKPDHLKHPTFYMVVSQVDGYPATEGYDDWFGSYEDANDVAYRLSQGEVFENQF